jgi:hypothetical protein
MRPFQGRCAGAGPATRSRPFARASQRRRVRRQASEEGMTRRTHGPVAQWMRAVGFGPTSVAGSSPARPFLCADGRRSQARPDRCARQDAGRARQGDRDLVVPGRAHRDGKSRCQALHPDQRRSARGRRERARLSLERLREDRPCAEAAVAQGTEHQLAELGVGGSIPPGRVVSTGPKEASFLRRMGGRGSRFGHPSERSWRNR